MIVKITQEQAQNICAGKYYLVYNLETKHYFAVKASKRDISHSYRGEELEYYTWVGGKE